MRAEAMTFNFHIYKILAWKLENKQANGFLNLTRSNWRYNLCVERGELKRMKQDEKLVAIDIGNIVKKSCSGGRFLYSVEYSSMMSTKVLL